MSGQVAGHVLQVMWAAPSIAEPGAETLVTREAEGTKAFRGYEISPEGAFDALTHRFTIERAAEVAGKLLRGDPQALGDPRAALLVAAALLAVMGERPEPPRDITLPETVKAGDLG
jgi:hypothetical protein